MSAREIVAYAISHAPPGVKGGPYEGAGRLGDKVASIGQAFCYKGARAAQVDAAWLGCNGYTARVIRIVRKARPSEASAVEVLRSLVAKADARDVGPGVDWETIDAARAVLAASGPDPMPVVRAAMVWWLACQRRAGRPLDLEIKTLDAVDTYRKAGGK